jgi:hypothetical protein
MRRVDLKLKTTWCFAMRGNCFHQGLEVTQSDLFAFCVSHQADVSTRARTILIALKGHKLLGSNASIQALVLGTRTLICLVFINFFKSFRVVIMQSVGDIGLGL